MRKVFYLALFLFSFTVHAFTVIHTNDVLGDIEPCGCRHNPQGGMARKFHLLQRTQAQDPFVIQVDAGDFLFSTTEIPDLLQAQAELQAKYLLKTMDLLHHDIVVPGEKDFSLGLKVFEKLTKNS